MAGSIKDLSKYRYEKSVEQIKVAETLMTASSRDRGDDEL